MNNTQKGIQLSFVLHTLLVIFLLGMGDIVKYDKVPVVIDFTCESASQVKKGAFATPVKKQENQTEIKRSAHSQAPKKKQAVAPKPAPKTDLFDAPNSAPITAKPDPIQEVPAAFEQGPAMNTAPDDNIAGGESGAPNPEEQKTRYMKEHFIYIRDLILQNIAFPPIARKMGWSGRVMVSFTISEKGHVDNIKIVESSGFGVLDNNAADTIKRVSPFPKPPVEAQLTVPIVYRLN